MTPECKSDCLVGQVATLWKISAEASGALPADGAVGELFQKCDNELRTHGLSLDNTVLVRVWGRDRDARTSATAARSKVFTGKRRAASSSFISAEWFDSSASAGLELLMMRPLDGAAARNPVDFEPPRNYVCCRDYDAWFFFSGFTSEAPSLKKQVVGVLAAIDSALVRAKSDWSRLVKLSVFVQRGQDLEIVRRVLTSASRMNISEIEFSLSMALPARNICWRSRRPQ